MNELDSDLLLLIDSCQAVPRAFDCKGRGVVSALTATGFEPEIMSAAPEVGQHSFTHSLIEELGHLSQSVRRSEHSEPFSDVSLHSALMERLRTCSPALQRRRDGSFRRDEDGCHVIEPYRRRTPIYQFLSRNKPSRPLPLYPLEPSVRGSPAVHGSASTDGSPGAAQSKINAPHVLVNVRLAQDSIESSDIDAWVHGFWIFRAMRKQSTYPLEKSKLRAYIRATRL